MILEQNAHVENQLSTIERFIAALKSLLKRVLPASFRLWLRRAPVRISESPMYKCVRFGSFRRVTPIHSGFSSSRGNYIDRYYIERFLAAHSIDVTGHVLELSGDEYTRRFGTKVTKSDVLDVRADHKPATIVADLTDADHLPSDLFDCIIFTQSLHFIYDFRAALRTLYRTLKPGGVLLASAPGITPISAEEMEYCGDFWRFTSLSLRRVFEEVFPAELVEVRSEGNVLAATAFLHGLAAEELRADELDYQDPRYEVSILVRAAKPGERVSA